MWTQTEIQPRPQTTADPHTLHCEAETEPARLQGPMCLGTEEHQKFIRNSYLDDFNHTKYTSVYKEIALEINVHWTEEEGASIVQTFPLLQH